MFVAFLLSLIVASTASPDSLKRPKIDEQNVTHLDNFLLPTISIPSKYQITLNVPSEALSGGSTLFTGSVIITFEVTQPTHVIHLHSLVNITNVDLAVNSSPVIPVAVTNHTFNATTEILVVRLPENLNVSVFYDLKINYSGNLDPVSMKGFYRSEYVSNGNKEYLGVTQFEPTSARRAFPCFDEPQYKATFILAITYPREFNAVSNTPEYSTTTIGDFATKQFNETPKMSTYLLAFIVSKFDCTNSTGADVLIEVCSRKEFVGDTTMALNYSVQLLEALNTWTNLTYNSSLIGKMDQYAIPDFSAGAMENWGLVTYRENSLLWNNSFTSNIYKQRIITIIAHEFAHMWFGNLVTTKWWDTIFLNEGFARYFQYFILNQISDFADFEIGKQFIIEQQQSVFVEDSSSKAPCLTSMAWTPSEISAKFGSISYQKGASVIRMIENLVGPEVFQEALRQYLRDNSYQAITPDKLWAAFGNFTPNGTLPENVTFPDFINNWTNKGGFPVVSVTLNGTNVSLSQKRFLYSGNDSTEWYVPITYILPGKTELQTTWLNPNTVASVNITTNNSWIIVNHNSRGYYRVHYDSTLRERLISILRNNFTDISDLNRAQIIDDALNLARAGYIKYSEAFKLLDYLKNETSYYPWYVAIRGLNYLSARFPTNYNLGQKISGMLLDLIDNISANVSTTNWDATDQITTLKLQTVWATACKNGQQSCVLETRRLFQEFMENGTSVNPNVRNIVYCNALRYTTDVHRDYTFLWKRLQAINQPHEYLYILVSLGCTTDKQHLISLLNQTLNATSVIRLQDFATVWSAVYSSSPIGLEVAFDYFIKNHLTILNYKPDASSILSNIVARFTTEAEIKKLQQFINEQPTNATIRSVANLSLTEAQQNVKWQTDIQQDLNGYFGILSPSTSSATRFGISFSLLCLVLFFI